MPWIVFRQHLYLFTMPILWQRTLGKQPGKQTENTFSLARDTLPYISMQTDHDLRMFAGYNFDFSTSGFYLVE